MSKSRSGMTLLNVVEPVAAPGSGVRDRFPSAPFIWWATGLAVTMGFGLGMLLFLHLSAGHAAGLWWVAAVQAHGHVQLFGWAGMFALGVGLYFLPRLRGCPPPSPRAVRAAAWLMGSGLVLRALAQPTLAALDPGAQRAVTGGALVLSGLLELGGAVLAVGALVRAERQGPPLAGRTGLLAVIPFMLTFFASLLLALTINAVTLATDAQHTGLVPGTADSLMVQLGLFGMLVPISAAVSARTFPLFLRLRIPPRGELSAVFAVYLIGLLCRLTALLDLPPMLQSVPAFGAVVLGLACLGLVVVLDVPLRRSARARKSEAGRSWPVVPEYRASEWLILPAYTWLGVAGLLLIADGLSWWGLVPRPPTDAERHALGAGLITLLILGMAIRMIPGFAGRKLHSAGLVWATVWLGNGAVLLRVLPLFLPSSRADCSGWLPLPASAGTSGRRCTRHLPAGQAA